MNPYLHGNEPNTRIYCHVPGGGGGRGEEAGLGLEAGEEPPPLPDVQVVQAQPEPSWTISLGGRSTSGMA